MVPTVSSFEKAVKELKFPPDQYVHSQRLWEWAWRYKNSKFIPESLLQEGPRYSAFAPFHWL